MNLEEVYLLHRLNLAGGILPAYDDCSVLLRAHYRHQLPRRRNAHGENFPGVFSQIINFYDVRQISTLNASSSYDDLEFINGACGRILRVEYHGTYLLPFLGDYIVPAAAPLQLLLFCAKSAEHVDETLIITNCLVEQILVSGVTLLSKHQLVLIVEEKDVWARN